METLGIALGSIWITWDGAPSSRLLNHIFRHREHNITQSTTTHKNTFFWTLGCRLFFSRQRLPIPITALPTKHALLSSLQGPQPAWFFPLLFSLVAPSLGLCNEWSFQRKLLEILLIRVSQLFSLQFSLESQLDTSWFKKATKDGAQLQAKRSVPAPC